MENQDSVCYVGKIKEIKEIPGCDNIVSAKVNDWNTIIKKDGYNIGDLVGVAITDAVLPEEMVTKLDIKSYLRKGVRVRTVRLKGVYSECLVFDIDANYKEGQDLMKDFNVVKYEEPVKMIQGVEGRKHKYHQNPNFHIYYKFPNQKNVSGMFNEEDTVIITRKIHGSNFRASICKKHKLTLLDKIKKLFGVKYIDYTFCYGSHNVEKGSDNQGYYSTDIWREMVDKYNIKEKLLNYLKIGNEFIGDGIIIYGEVYGTGVQGEKYNYGLNERKLVIFDIEVNNLYLDTLNFNDFINYLNLPIVEVLYEGKWSKKIEDSLVGGYIEGTKTPHEGIVVKCTLGDRKKIYKCINPDYHIFSEKNNVPDSH